MNLIKGVDPIYEIDKYDVVLVGTSVYDLLVNGFQFKMGNRYPHIVEANHSQPYGDLRRIGTRLTLVREGCPTISLLYVCGYPKRGLKTLDYNALEECLRASVAEFRGKKIATTIIGSTVFDGEGSKRKILNLMKKVFGDEDVTVYDYEQVSGVKEYREKAATLRKIGVRDRKKRKEILKKLYLTPIDG